MADDPLTARMTALRVALVGGDHDECYKAGRALWSAVNAALNVHRKGTRFIPAYACPGHYPGGPNGACPKCHPEVRDEICPECRDGFGDPVLFTDCRVRAAIADALTGEGKSDGA